MDIEIFDDERAARHLNRFAEILRGAVHGGALVGYILPFELDTARSYWQGVIQSIADGERVLICAVIGGEVAGTVQVYLSPESNAQHRAEINKLLVHAAYQRQGVGEALMRAVEDQARHHGRTVLLLDIARAASASGSIVGSAGRKSAWCRVISWIHTASCAARSIWCGSSTDSQLTGFEPQPIFFVKLCVSRNS